MVLYFNQNWKNHLIHLLEEPSIKQQIKIQAILTQTKKGVNIMAINNKSLIYVKEHEHLQQKNKMNSSNGSNKMKKNGNLEIRLGVSSNQFKLLN